MSEKDRQVALCLVLLCTGGERWLPQSFSLCDWILWKKGSMAVLGETNRLCKRGCHPLDLPCKNMALFPWSGLLHWKTVLSRINNFPDVLLTYTSTSNTIITPSFLSKEITEISLLSYFTYDGK